jgi:hypothetical protein
VQRSIDIVEQAAAGQQRRIMLQGNLARGVLQTEVAHLRGCRPYECDARRLALLGECGVLAQKAVAWVNSLRARPQRGLDDQILAQVTFSRRRGAEAYGFVSTRNVQGMAVRIRVDGHRGDVQTPQRPQDAAGNRAAVGDQHLVEHET